MAATATRTKEGQHEDELPFGDFCFNCGNATTGTPYCSADCRKADLDRSETPDFSPSLCAVPPLVSSAKSACSTPPSSATNSPSPRNGVMSDFHDPPALDLPPPKHSFEYGGQSLPSNGLRFPATWTISYQPDPLASPGVTPTDAPPAGKEISYRRKPNRPQSAVPSPLYFRQTAAIVHSSPAFGPVSPATRLIPLHPATDYSFAHVPEDDIADLSLPSQHEHASNPPPLLPMPVPTNCGRLGCVGVPARPRIDTAVAGASAAGRRQSWQGSNGFRVMTSIEQNDDVLMSPRIMALRTGRSPAPTEENKQSHPPSPLGDGGEAGDAHSAFACYLFSHLTAEPVPEKRGRQASIDHSSPEMTRSLSVDAAVANRSSAGGGAVSNSNNSSPVRAVRPIRGMMGGRGPANGMRSEPAILPLTPADSANSPPSSRSRSRSRNHDRDATIRPVADRASRPALTPGHFISATTDSPSNGSLFPSPPPSPPSRGRGRSSARRMSTNATIEGCAVGGYESPDPRGRSRIRDYGAVQRSMSPSARKESPSGSRSRSRSRSHTQTRAGSRTSYSRGRGGERASSRGRGRTRERTVEEDEQGEEEAAVVEEDEEDERGRGRERGSRSRSRSMLRRGRGRETIIAGAAYGHYDSSDESDRERGRGRGR